MKRTLCEITAAGAVLFLLAGVYAEVDGLRKAGVQRTADIARIASDLDGSSTVSASAAKEAPSEDYSSSLRQHSERLAKLHDHYNGLQSQLGDLESRVEESKRSASKQATDAIVKSVEISQEVKDAHQEIVAAQRDLARKSESIQRRLLEYRTLLTTMRSEGRRDPSGMTRDMLTPTIQLSGDETVGSGVVISSRRRVGGKGYDSYVLTAYHVVRNILADDPSIAKRGITVTLYNGTSKTTRLCDLLIKDAKMDVALCKLRGNARVARVAKMIAPSRVDEIKVWHPVYAVGCPLGNDPIPTGGFVASLASEVRGTSYWMVNSPTYYGNSGGGIYCGEERELVAVFSKIYTHGSSRPVVIPHMGLCVPMTLVYPWLQKNGFGQLVPTGEARGELAQSTDAQPAAKAAGPSRD